MSFLTRIALLACCVAQDPARSFDFESDRPGEVPAGWFVPRGVQAGYGAEVVEGDAFEGERCVRVFELEDGEPASFGNAMTSLDARPYRGRTIRVRAALRATGGSRAQMWVRVDRPERAKGLFDNMSDRPVTDPEWTEVEIRGDVHADAEGLSLGVMLTRGSEVFFDAVRIEDLGPLREPLPARALTARGLENLTALARLYGYVRYFHPSDEAEATEWESWLVQAIQAVEGASDPAELAERLEAVLAPIAPAVRVGVAGAELELAPELDGPPDGERVRLRSWSHFGVGLAEKEGRSIYSSRRRNKRPKDGVLPEDVRAPREVVRSELAGGVACALPTSLFATRAGTLPRPAPDAAPIEATSLLGGEDRSSRLAAVMIAWNVFQHFYPYFDVVEADWPGELTRALSSAASDEDEGAFLATLERMVAALHDGHGSVSGPGDVRSGILPLSWAFVEGALTITRVPARLANELRPGDVVASIDGRATEEWVAERSAHISAATPQYLRHRLTQDLALGPREVPATLVLEGVDGRRRGPVRVPYGSYSDIQREPRPGPIEELEAGVFYVDIGRVDDETFGAALEDLAAAEGIVWDSRGYPGLGFDSFLPHLVAERSTSPQWHVPEATLPDRLDQTTRKLPGWRIEPAEPRLAGRHVFLVDGRAISYAESCLGIVEHYELGELVGEASAGTNGNVNPFTLPGNYRISWTGMKVLKHDGSRHHGVGILPTVPVERTRAGVAAGRDEILEAGLEVLRRALR